MNSHIFFKPLLYLDPGTGSFIIQILLASLFGIGVAVKIYWKKIINFLRGNKKRGNVDFLDKVDEFGDEPSSIKEEVEKNFKDE